MSGSHCCCYQYTNIYVFPVSVLQCPLCLWSKLKGEKSSSVTSLLTGLGVYLGLHICQLSGLLCALREEAGSYLEHGGRVVLNCILLYLGHFRLHIFHNVILNLQEMKNKIYYIISKASQLEHVVFTMTKRDTAGRSAIWQGSSATLGVRGIEAENAEIQLLTNC